MKPLYLILIASLLASCATVKKNGYWQTRRYNYGKHIVKEVRGKNTRPAKPSTTSILPIQTSLESHFIDLYSDSITLDVSDSVLPYLSTITHPSVTPTDSILVSDSCDQITTTRGRVIRCTIVDVTLEGYHYVNCPDGTVPHLIERDKIREVRRADGTVVHFEMNSTSEEKKGSWWKRAIAWTLGLTMTLSILAGLSFDPASRKHPSEGLFVGCFFFMLIWVIALPIILVIYLIGLFI